MSLTFIFAANSRAIIDTLTLDASLSESHKLTAKTTSFPIEDGSLISDHILNDPKTLTIEGFITDTPLTYLTGLRDALSNISGSGSPSKTAFKTLTDLYEKKSKIEVTTGLQVYKNMVIESLDFPRDAKTGKALRFNIGLKQITLTSFTTTAISADKLGDVNGSQDQATPQQNVGKQQTVAPSDSEASILKTLFDRLKEVRLF